MSTSGNIIPSGLSRSHTVFASELNKDIPSACVCLCVQGGRWRWRQSGRRQQPTRYHLHRLQDVPEHCRQRQGRKHTHRAAGDFLLCRGRGKDLKADDRDSLCGPWRADKPQLSQRYRVSRAATMGRSRGRTCASGRKTVCVHLWVRVFSPKPSLLECYAYP